MENGRERVIATRGFDYGTLIRSVRKHTEEEARAIKGLLAKTASNIVQIGLRLQWVREQIGREHFQEWLKAEFDWSQSVASNFMRTASVFAEVDCLSQFQPSALYLLARHRVPKAARQEAFDRARRGELITKARAQSILLQRAVGRTLPKSYCHIASQVQTYIQRLTRELENDELAKLAEKLIEIGQKLKQSSGHVAIHDASGNRTRTPSR